MNSPKQRSDFSTDTGDTLVTFLGGLGEIGNNCMVLEQAGGTLVIDCGFLFPPANMIGVPKFVPDLTYLRGKRIDGLLLTHGHEDHIGAVPRLLQEHPGTTVFAAALTHRLLESKLSEYRVRYEAFMFDDLVDFDVGTFRVKPLPVCHNIPDGVALHITTANGTVFHSGDLKLDPHAPDGRNLDLDLLTSLCSDHPFALALGDSTNAMIPGRVESEEALHPTIDKIFGTAPDSRLICSTFASNIHRHASFIQHARAHNRNIHVMGRSIERMVKIAMDLGYVETRGDISFGRSVPEATDGSICILTTGSQAEPMSGLQRMAKDQHQSVHLGANDVVVLSSSRVPGNERSIATLAGQILDRGSTLVDIDNADIHASGHAYRDDLLEIASALRCRTFIPIHGETRHMQAHAALARATFGPETQVLTARDGDCIAIRNERTHVAGRRVAGKVAVDDGLIDLGGENVSERDYIGRHGVVFASILVYGGSMVEVTEVALRQVGWVAPEVFLELTEDLVSACSDSLLSGSVPLNRGDPSDLERLARRGLGSVVTKLTKRKPRLVIQVIPQ